MITINKTLTIEGGNPPYTYLVNMIGNYTSNSPTSSVAEIELNFTTTNTNAELIGFDSEGCSFVYNLTNEGICNSLRLSPISQSNDTYQALAIGACDIIYTWEYEEQYYRADINDNVITLTQYRNAPDTTLKLTVTDCNGCSLSTERTIIPCNVTANNVNVLLTENENGRWLGSTILPVSTDCGTIVYSTFNPSVTSLITSTITGSTVSFSVPSYLRNAPITYNITNSLGITSNRATIQFQSQQPGTTTPNTPNPGTTPIGTGSYTITEGTDYQGEVNSVRLINSPTNTLNSTLDGFTINYDYQGGTQIQGYQLINDSNTITNYLTFLPEPTQTVIPNQVVNVTCDTPSVLDISSFTPAIIDITSSDTSLDFTNNTLSFSANQSKVISATAYNEEGQSTNLDINICHSCILPITITTCDRTFTPYNFLGDVPTTGTFNSFSTAPVPTNYNSEITVPNVGTYFYFYDFTPSPLSNNYTCPILTASLTVQVLPETFISNNTLATAKDIISTTTPSVISLQESVTNNCDNKVTATAQNFSTTINYDLWYNYVVPSNLTPNTDYSVTFKVDSNNLVDPLSSPLLALYKNQSVHLISNYRSNSYNEIIYTFNSNEVQDLILQLGSVSTGNFIVSVRIEEGNIA